MNFKNLTHRVIKNVCFTAMISAVCFITSCQKDSVNPDPSPLSVAPTGNSNTTATSTAAPDTTTVVNTSATTTTPVVTAPTTTPVATTPTTTTPATTPAATHTTPTTTTPTTPATTPAAAHTTTPVTTTPATTPAATHTTTPTVVTTPAATTTHGATPAATTTHPATAPAATTHPATAPAASAPATTTHPTTAPVAVTPVKKVSHYKLTAPIYLVNKSNLTISGDSINGGTSVGIFLINCTNIHITKCKIMNSNQKGISLNNCTNVLVDSCYISNVSTGVYAYTGSQIKVMNNQFLNMTGPYPNGSFVQFSGVTGGNNRISYNKCEDVMGKGNNPNPGGGDGINLYKSNGLPSDPILVTGNWIRGGGTNTSSKGMSGIVAGDVGGSYQIIENNILVNTGYVGIQQQGGTNVTIKNNKIYSDLLPWSGLGLGSANYSGAPASNNTITGNQVNWHAGYNNLKQRDTSYKAGSGSNSNLLPAGWKSNNVKANIDASILPAVFIKQPY